MAQKTPSQNSGKAGESREDRLKAALKANLARRKAQAKARKGSTGTPEADNAGK